MSFSIDATTYNRTLTHKIRDGYQTRGGIKPSSIVIHSTNGKRGSSFDEEARFLRDSPNVSAHYLVGREGQVALIVPPEYQAWHAGQCLPDWANARSLGIECHHAVGEPWTQAQYAALTELTRQLITQFAIPEKLIETHRAIARPPGRKSDPNDWPDHDFYAWRASLYALPPVPLDPFAAWGDIARPEGDQRGWAIPRTWLQNQWLGRCLQGETWFAPGICSAACFERGAIVYEKASDRARVVPFGGGA